MKSDRTFAVNRKARFEYEILDTVEAGVVLVGTEIKAIREGRANLADAYGRPEEGELWLVGAHIAQYSAGGPNNHDPTRPRKLLLHKEQIKRLSKQVTEKGLTIVPLRLYLRRHRAKVQLALAGAAGNTTNGRPLSRGSGSARPRRPSSDDCDSRCLTPF